MPLGRVPLLARPLLVIRENGVHDSLPWPQLGSPDRRLPPVPRRHRILQHLPNHLPGQPELPGHRTSTLAFHRYRPPHSSIQQDVRALFQTEDRELCVINVKE